MAKVTNLTDRGINIRGWRVLPNSSKVVDYGGHIHKEMPDRDAYCPGSKRLADDGVLELEGYRPKVKTVKPAKTVVPDPPKVKVEKFEDKVEVVEKVEKKYDKKKPGKR